MPELMLTKHFIERWMQRVGNWPTQAAVQHFISQSLRVQPCRDLLRLDGQHYRVLAIYWHPDLDLVIKVDTVNWTAVTVLSRENWRADDQQATLVPYAPKSKSITERISRIRRIFGIQPKCA